MKRYTETEIISMFNDCEVLSNEFKNEINLLTSGWMQAMYNAVHNPKTMNLNNTYGDKWQEAHQKFSMIFQKYHGDELVGKD